MQIPTIGGPRGIFEILVPGVFLFLNLVGVVCISPLTRVNAADLIADFTSSQVFGLLLVVICFGYLLGTVLRLLWVDFIDRVCARCHQKRGVDDWRSEVSEMEYWRYEYSPYILSMDVLARHCLPPKVLEFYRETWAPRIGDGHNVDFFNFCKFLAASIDERSSKDVLAAESLCRYISSMILSLFVSCCSLVLVLISKAIYRTGGSVVTALVLGAYLIAILAFARQFRFMRIKEVLVVLAITFRHRAHLGEDLRDNAMNPERNARENRT